MQYGSTETQIHTVHAMRAAILTVLCGSFSVSVAQTACSKPGYAVYSDQHDGDMKKVSLGADGFVTITPYNNTQTWTIK